MLIWSVFVIRKWMYSFSWSFFMCTFNKPKVGKLTPFWQILQWYSAGVRDFPLFGLTSISSDVSSADFWDDFSGEEEVDPRDVSRRAVIVISGSLGIWIGVIEGFMEAEEGVLFLEDVDSSPYWITYVITLDFTFAKWRWLLDRWKTAGKVSFKTWVSRYMKVYLTHR